jgi:hypothetical protein
MPMKNEKQQTPHVGEIIHTATAILMAYHAQNTDVHIPV